MKELLHLQTIGERASRVLAISLAVPDRRNALSTSLLLALRHAVASALEAGVGAIVLCGSRDHFSAGADLDELTGTVADLSVDEEIAATTAVIRAAQVPVVAAIEGACIGAAVDIVLSCDARVAADTAFFEVPATRLSILYNPDAIARMASAVPDALLRRLFLLGERIDGADALAAGLATHVTPAGGTRARAIELAAHAALGGTEAVSATKSLLNGLATADEAAWAEWQRQRRDLLASDARKSALRSSGRAEGGGTTADDD